MKSYKIYLSLIALILGFIILIMKQPSIDDKVKILSKELNKKLLSEEVYIDPAELLDIMYNNNVSLKIFDVRDEKDFNLFHIIDSKRITMEEIKDIFWPKKLPKKTVIVLVSNDDEKATLAWKYLFAHRIENIYILKGGINFWLKLYGEKISESEINKITPDLNKDETLRYNFSSALGDKHIASDPDPTQVPKRNYIKKVKNIGNIVKKSGGCG